MQQGRATERILSAIAIWQASPGKVRAVAGQMHKVQGGGSLS